MAVSPKLTKASRFYQCECCEGSILDGKLYWRLTVFEDTPSTLKLCTYCYHWFFQPTWDDYFVSFISTKEELIERLRYEYTKDNLISYDDAKADLDVEKLRGLW